MSKISKSWRRAPRTALAACAVASLVAGLAACGGDGGGDLSAETAKSAGEKAAGVKLNSQAAPAQEVDKAYTSTAGGQITQLFVLKDAGDADEIKGQLEKATGAAGGAVKSAVNKNVVIIAGAVPGQDNKVDEALKAVQDL